MVNRNEVIHQTLLDLDIAPDALNCLILDYQTAKAGEFIQQVNIPINEAGIAIDENFIYTIDAKTNSVIVYNKLFRKVNEWNVFDDESSIFYNSFKALVDARMDSGKIDNCEEFIKVKIVGLTVDEEYIYLAVNMSLVSNIDIYPTGRLNQVMMFKKDGTFVRFVKVNDEKINSLAIDDKYIYIAYENLIRRCDKRDNFNGYVPNINTLEVTNLLVDNIYIYYFDNEYRSMKYIDKFNIEDSGINFPYGSNKYQIAKNKNYTLAYADDLYKQEFLKIGKDMGRIKLKNFATVDKKEYDGVASARYEKMAIDDEFIFLVNISKQYVHVYLL